jgi:hypothetical protein
MNYVLGTIGAIAGGYYGGPSGAAAGWSIGFAIGSAAMTKRQTVYNSQQQLADLTVTGTEYGQPIPWGRGVIYVAGQLWWNSDRIPVSTYTTSESGGKGDSGQTTITETINYYMHALYGVTDCEYCCIRRIWKNGKLIWTHADDATAAAVAASDATTEWSRITQYTGDASQLPDPVYQAHVTDYDPTVTQVPAYRGRGTVFIESLFLGQSGQVPNLTFEVVIDCAVAPALCPPVATNSTFTSKLSLGADADYETLVYVASTNEFWVGFWGSPSNYINRYDADTYALNGTINLGANDLWAYAVYDSANDVVWGVTYGDLVLKYDAATATETLRVDVSGDHLGGDILAWWRSLVIDETNGVPWIFTYSDSNGDLPVYKINPTTGHLEDEYIINNNKFNTITDAAIDKSGNCWVVTERWWTVPSEPSKLVKCDRTTPGSIAVMYTDTSNATASNNYDGIYFVTFDAIHNAMWMAIADASNNPSTRSQIKWVIKRYNIGAAQVDLTVDASAWHLYQSFRFDPQHNILWFDDFYGHGTDTRMVGLCGEDGSIIHYVHFPATANALSYHGIVSRKAGVGTNKLHLLLSSSQAIFEYTWDGTWQAPAKEFSVQHDWNYVVSNMSTVEWSYPSSMVTEDGYAYSIWGASGSLWIHKFPVDDISASADVVVNSVEGRTAIGHPSMTYLRHKGIYVAEKNSIYLVGEQSDPTYWYVYYIRYNIGTDTFTSQRYRRGQNVTPLLVYDDKSKCLYSNASNIFGDPTSRGIVKINSDNMVVVDYLPLPNMVGGTGDIRGLALDKSLNRLIVTHGWYTVGSEYLSIIDLASFTATQQEFYLSQGMNSMWQCVAANGHLWALFYSTGSPTNYGLIRKWNWNSSSGEYEFATDLWSSNGAGFGMTPTFNYIEELNAIVISGFLLDQNYASYTDADNMSVRIYDADTDALVSILNPIDAEPGSPQPPAYSTWGTIQNRKGFKGFYISGYELDGVNDGAMYTYEQANSKCGLPELTYEDVQRSVFRRAGLQDSQFDVSALASIATPVRSLIWSEASARVISETLANTGAYNFSVSDKLYATPRGGSPAVSIPFEDLGTSLTETFVEPLLLEHASDIEIPARASVTYQNMLNDYQTDTQMSDRLISSVSQSVANTNLQQAMRPNEAKIFVDRVQNDMIASRVNTTLNLQAKYAALEPNDVVLVTGGDGTIWRLRLVERTDEHPALVFKAVIDDPTVLVSSGITSANYNSQTVVKALAGTIMMLLDIPILRDADDDAGFYVAAGPDSDGSWPGCVIYSSVDDVSYTSKTNVASPATVGTASTKLGDWTGGRVFDTVNTVTVDLNGGTFSSMPRASLLNDQSVNAFLIGDELIQAATGTFVSSGVYVLSNLLRGARGTEWATGTHVAGERVVRLQASGIRRVMMTGADIGVSYYYKGVTNGTLLDDATAELFADNAVGLKPFSCYDLRATRDGSGNITFTWQRRSRLAVRAIGASGIYLPLGEASEDYELDIIGGSPLGAVRTISASTVTVGYSATDQTTDFGSTQAQVTVRLYQISAVVGRGYVYEATL